MWPPTWKPGRVACSAHRWLWRLHRQVRQLPLVSSCPEAAVLWRSPWGRLWVILVWAPDVQELTFRRLWPPTLASPLTFESAQWKSQHPGILACHFHSSLSDPPTHRIHVYKSLYLAITRYTTEQNATCGPREGQQILSKPREQSSIIKANGFVLKSTRWTASLSGPNSISSPCDHTKTETTEQKESATNKCGFTLSLFPARAMLSYTKTFPHRS